MAKTLLFTKLKGFGPLIVIGTAVAITIKLLTTTTPTIQDELNVDAKEDISLTQYQDEIEIPPPQEEPAPAEEKEVKEEEKEKGDEEESEDDENEKETEEVGEETEEVESPPEKKEEPKGGRAWITDPNNLVAGMLKKIFTPKQEK